MITILIISIILNIIFVFVTTNLFRKNEFYEQTIEDFYSRLNITLHTMRMIDEKQMFESDDDVGTVFQQITDTVNDLRPLLYGASDDGTSKN
jgi:hypothetical protein